MSYRKILVDNITCSRRFHIAYEDAAKPVANVELRCSYCEKVIFHEQDHPPATIIREENLIKAAELSDNIIQDCDFKDQFSKRTVPGFGDSKLYP